MRSPCHARLVLFLLTTLSACDRPSPPAAPSAAGARPALSVTRAEARVEDWERVIEASGVIAAWHEATVSAATPGEPLVEVRAEVGDAVEAGQLLARFDDRNARVGLAQAEASLAEARAGARQAAADHERYLMLAQTQAISAQTVQQAETDRQVAEAQQASAEAALLAARIDLENTRVTAPDGGLISSRSAALGEVAQAGAELFRLIRQGRLEWQAELNADYLAQIGPGQSVSLELPDGSSARGQVRQLAPALDDSSRLALAYVALEPASSARAGMYASGSIAVGRASALWVPAGALVIRDGRGYVFRLRDQQVEQVGVTSGRRRGEQLEILNGLEVGESVVVQGAGFLSDGDSVRIVAAGDAPEVLAGDAR